MDTIKCKTIKTSKYNILLLITYKTHTSLFRWNPEKNYCFTLPYAYNKTVGAVFFFFFFFGDDKTIIILILFTFFNVWDEICNTIPCYHVKRTIYTNIFYNSIIRKWRFDF